MPREVLFAFSFLMNSLSSSLALLALAIALTRPPVAAAAELTLAENGKARAVIVVGSDDPWKMEPGGKPGRALTTHQMAAILASQLEQMCGATFEMVSESALGEASFANGRLSFASAPAGRDLFLLVGEGTVTRKCGLTTEKLGPGGILVKTLGNAVAMIGRSDHSYVGGGGTGYAVFQFLEALGCRWLWPGELGKVVPRTPTLRAPNLDLRYSPKVVQRGIRFMPHGPRYFDKGLERLGMAKDAYTSASESAANARVPAAWQDWMCLGGDLGIVGGHAGYGLKGGWEEHGKTHPEWFALQPDGTRDQSAAGGRWRACTSNPGLIEQVAKTILEEADKNRLQRCFSLAPNDGGTANYCVCEECKKLDPPEAPKIPLRVFAKVGSGQTTEIQHPSLTDRHVHYWNAVAEKVAAARPDLLLSIDAYAEYATPPVREKLHPSLVLRYVPTETAGWKGWQEAGAKKIFWRPNALHTGYRAGALWIVAGGLVENARYLAANGMLATDVQGIYSNWATQGLNYYAMARIFWNPNLTWPEILDDYCRSGFGAGADSVKRFFLRAEALRPPLPYGLDDKSGLTPESLAELKGYLKAAHLAAMGDDPVRKRIAFLAAGMDHTAATAELYELSRRNPVRDPSLIAKRWASMRDLFSKYPLAVNVALVAGFDDPLLRSFGEPSQPAAPAAKSNAGEDGPDWLFEDQTPTKARP